MARRWSTSERTLLSILLTGTALILIAFTWFYTQNNPASDDAYVLANVIGVAPRVPGQVLQVHVQDNQRVKKSDPLFDLDPVPYEVEVAKAYSELEKVEAAARQAHAHAERIEAMAARGFISANDAESAASHRDESAGLVKAARALLTEKELRLGNTRVQAPVNGIVTNLRLSPGTFLRAGQEILALIDEDSWHVSAYFEKTSLHNLKPGATAEVRLLMYPDYVFQGPVEGIGWGVFQSDGSAPDSLLPTLQPTVDWVRLAARVPVRVNLRNFDRDRPLRIGARATVKIFAHSTYKEPEPKQ